MLRNIVLTLWFASLFLGTSQASWEEAGSQYAGRGNGITVGYADTSHAEYLVYVADSSYRVYTSSNMGVLWYERDTSTTHATCVITPPENSDLAYVGRFDVGVHKTTNGGQTWNATGLMRTNQQVLSLGFSPMDRDYKIIAGLDSLVTEGGRECVNQYSPDGGANWYHFPMDVDMKVYSPLSVYAFVDDQTDSVRFYEAAGHEPNSEAAHWGVYLVRMLLNPENGGPEGGEFYLKLDGDARAIAGEVSSDTIILYAGIYSKVGESAEEGV